MTFRQKVDKVLLTNKLKIHSIAALEDKIQVGRNTLKKAYDDDREPTLKVLVKLYEYFNVSSSWWETGKGEIFEEKSTSVVEEDKVHYGVKKVEVDKVKEIPFYDTVAVGGQSMLADQSPVNGHNAEMINPGTWFRTASGALRVYGHSMFPKYPAGCIVAFKESEKDVIMWGEDYVLELNDRRVVKRVEKSKKDGFIMAVSYNKSEEYVYDPVEIPINKIKRIFMVMGKVELEASI